MKKQLNTHGILNELKGGSHFFGTPPTASLPPTDFSTAREMLLPEAQVSTNLSPVQPVDPSTDQLNDPPIDQSTGQSTTTSATPLAGQPIDRSPILGRPKAFYITEQQDRDLDLAVSKLGLHTADKIGQKIDRSTVLRLLLEGADLTNDLTIDQLTNQLVSRLIRQLTG